MSNLFRVGKQSTDDSNRIGSGRYDRWSIVERDAADGYEWLVRQRAKPGEFGETYGWVCVCFRSRAEDGAKGEVINRFGISLLELCFVVGAVAQDEISAENQTRVGWA